MPSQGVSSADGRSLQLLAKEEEEEGGRRREGATAISIAMITHRLSGLIDPQSS